MAVLVVMMLATLSFGAGIAVADPSPAPTSAPTSDPAAPQTTDPAAPSPSDTSDPDLKIKSGTAKEGTIHWDKFGGGTKDAPQTLDEFFKLIVGWALTIFGVMVVISGLFVCMAMGLGFKGRSGLAKAALESSLYLILAVVLVGSIGTITGLMFLGAGLT